MTDLGPFGDPAGQPGSRTRHRRSTGLGAKIGALLPAGRRPTRKEWVIAAAALALIAVLGLGWLAVRDSGKKDSALEIPPLATPSATAPPAGGDPSPAPPPASGPPSPAPSPAPSPSAAPPDPQPDPPPGNDDGRDEDGEDDGGKEESAPLPEPRLVGPADAAGWENLLTDFCKKRGDNRAVLLPGDGGDSDGEWVCLEVTTFEAINLDEPCRRNFGDASQARQTQRGDARTWRCFDR